MSDRYKGSLGAIYIREGYFWRKMIGWREKGYTELKHAMAEVADCELLAAELNRHARKSPNGRA